MSFEDEDARMERLLRLQEARLDEDAAAAAIAREAELVQRLSHMNDLDLALHTITASKRPREQDQGHTASSSSSSSSHKRIKRPDETDDNGSAGDQDSSRQEEEEEMLLPAAESAIKAFEREGDYIEDWQLSDEQLEFIRLAMSGVSLFGTGGGGVGKSYMLKALFQRWSRTGHPYVATATTGTAACQIGGITLHMHMRLGICEDAIPVIKKHVKKDPELQLPWTTIRTLTVDEVSMLQPRLMDVMDQAARTARKCWDKPFGGLQVVFTGDFAQLPSVITDEDRELSRNRTAKFGQIEAANHKYEFAFEHPVWQQAIGTSVQLTRVFRQTDPAFVGLLHRIRMGEPQPGDHAELMGLVRHTAKFRTLEDMMDTNGVKPTQLNATKREVKETNDEALRKLEPDPSKRYTYAAETQVVNVSPDNEKYFEAWLHQMRTDSPAKDNITFAIGSQVMLTKNLDVAGGLTNGSRGVVTGLSAASRDDLPDEPERGVADHRPYPIVQFTNGVVHTIKRQIWQRKHESTMGVATYSQIPLQLADAVTVHKCQGSTLDRVLIRLGSMNHWGQAYTALSRVRTKEGLFVSSYSKACIKIHPKVKKFYADIQRVADEKRHPRTAPPSSSSSLPAPATAASLAPNV